MSVPNIPVYIIHNSKSGKIQVKSSCQQRAYKLLMAGETEGLPEWAKGFTGDVGSMSWKAQRAIARKYIEAGGELL